jgi:hypothetical protein
MVVIDKDYKPTEDEQAIIQAIDEEFEREGGNYHGLEITEILTDFYQIRLANWYGGFFETDNCARVLHLNGGTFVRLFMTKDWENNLRFAENQSKWW